MKLMYSDIPTGDRLWFVREGLDFIGIRLTFDREMWTPFSYKHNKGRLYSYLKNAYEAENKRDYYNVIKTIFEKEKV